MATLLQAGSCFISILFGLGCPIGGIILGAWMKLQDQKSRAYANLRSPGSTESEPDER